MSSGESAGFPAVSTEPVSEPPDDAHPENLHAEKTHTDVLHSVSDAGDSATDPGVEVFWRPGCPYCSALRRTLDRHQVSATWRNIWTDESARSFVRSVNAGNETVPTVRIGARTLTNPSWAQLDKLLGDGPWRHQVRRASPTLSIVSWVPVVALIAASLVLAAAGHDGLSWGVDALAVAAWWFTRPLRR